MAKGHVGFNDVARVAGAKARKECNRLRTALALKYKLPFSAFRRGDIMKTIEDHHIPIKNVHASLIPKPEKAPKPPQGNGKAFSLAGIPDKAPPVVKKYTKRVEKVDNTHILLRVLDLLERIVAGVT